jgi:hypothetical protein
VPCSPAAAAAEAAGGAWNDMCIQSGMRHNCIANLLVKNALCHVHLQQQQQQQLTI